MALPKKSLSKYASSFVGSVIESSKIKKGNHFVYIDCKQLRTQYCSTSKQHFREGS